MIGLATLRREKTTWGRRVLGTFVVAWLAIVLQPCAMAMGADSDPCPHCPPAETPPCETTITPDCGLDDQLTNESRSNPSKVKDVPDEPPVAIQPDLIQSAWIDPRARPLPPASHFFNPSGPPLNVLYCVYLK